MRAAGRADTASGPGGCACSAAVDWMTTQQLADIASTSKRRMCPHLSHAGRHAGEEVQRETHLQPVDV
jgi:hypothetical protein